MIRSRVRVLCYIVLISVVIAIFLHLKITNTKGKETKTERKIEHENEIDQEKSETYSLPLYEKNMKCHQTPKGWSFDNVALFDDLLTAETKMEPGKSIFFQETSCFSNGALKLDAR